jgi:hypothetical protein
MNTPSRKAGSFVNLTSLARIREATSAPKDNFPRITMSICQVTQARIDR